MIPATRATSASPSCASFTTAFCMSITSTAVLSFACSAIPCVPPPSYLLGYQEMWTDSVRLTRDNAGMNEKWSAVMDRPATRLLTLLELMQNRQLVRSAELAAE